MLMVKGNFYLMGTEFLLEMMKVLEIEVVMGAQHCECN